MKTLLSFLLIAFLFSSCKQNLCEGVYCANGGMCKDGNCICPVNFTGNSCQTSTIPDCQRNHTGTFKIYNNTSYNLLVNCDSIYSNFLLPHTASNSVRLSSGFHEFKAQSSAVGVNYTNQSIQAVNDCSELSIVFQ